MNMFHFWGYPSHTQSKEQTDPILVEVGPRFVMNPVRIFESSFGGPPLWANSDYVSPNKVCVRECVLCERESVCVRGIPILISSLCLSLYARNQTRSLLKKQQGGNYASKTAQLQKRDAYVKEHAPMVNPFANEEAFASQSDDSDQDSDQEE
jgi:hypothetical protein